MKSVFAQLFLAIQEQIRDLVPEIKQIDQDLGQLEYYKERPALNFPCVLVDFPTAQFQDESQLVQLALLNVSLRLAFEPWSSASSEAPDVTKEDALEYYELELKLYAAMQGFDAEGCIQPLTRISVSTERREDVYRVREMLFTTATEDDTAKIMYQETQADLIIE